MQLRMMTLWGFILMMLCMVSCADDESIRGCFASYNYHETSVKIYKIQEEWEDTRQLYTKAAHRELYRLQAQVKKDLNRLKGLLQKSRRLRKKLRKLQKEGRRLRVQLRQQQARFHRDPEFTTGQQERKSLSQEIRKILRQTDQSLTRQLRTQRFIASYEKRAQQKTTSAQKALLQTKRDARLLMGKSTLP